MINFKERADWIIRPFADNDLLAVLNIEQAAHLSPWSEAIFKRTVSSGKLVYVVEEVAGEVHKKRSTVIAYAVISIVAGEAELLNLSVDATHQGRGIGKHLLSYVLNSLKSNAEQIFLEVRESNQVAINLYELAGFSELDRRVNYYPAKNGKEDALIFALTFLPE